MIRKCQHLPAFINQKYRNSYYVSAKLQHFPESAIKLTKKQSRNKQLSRLMVKTLISNHICCFNHTKSRE